MEILELSPLHWGWVREPKRRIRNRSIELVECERLARIFGSYQDVDLSSRRYVSAGCLPSRNPKCATLLLNDAHGSQAVSTKKQRPSRKQLDKSGTGVAAPGIQEHLRGNKASKRNLSRLRRVSICDRCSRETFGYSSSIDRDVEAPVRRCYICRGKVEHYCRHQEGTNPTLRSRRRAEYVALRAALKHKFRRPVKALPKPIRRKIWFTKCTILSPDLYASLATWETLHEVVENEPVDTDPQAIFWPDSHVRTDDSGNSVNVFVTTHITRNARGLPHKMTRAYATLLGETKMNPVNVRHFDGTPWRKGKSPMRMAMLRRRRKARGRAVLERIAKRRAHTASRKLSYDERRLKARQRHRQRALFSRERRHKEVMQREGARSYYLENIEEISTGRLNLRDDSDNEDDADRVSYFLSRGYTWNNGVWSRDALT